ncbi:MAG: hypothetical protein IJE43_16925 [Alphaproteobacteria bacterium]|nr:hypothetical protein [Alphaproteobacteria bacterium]MBR2507906.1 hypothetical protein [Bacilli bacterium]
MNELVIFKVIYDENADHEYGILNDRDEPDVICLSSGVTIEFGEYEIIERVDWFDISDLIREKFKKQQGDSINGN